MKAKLSSIYSCWEGLSRSDEDKKRQKKAASDVWLMLPTTIFYSGFFKNIRLRLFFLKPWMHNGELCQGSVQKHTQGDGNDGNEMEIY